MKNNSSLKIVFILLVFIYSPCVISQIEFSKWYFGLNAGIDFQTPTPTALFNSTMVATEGCASVSDNSGNLLFYTNGFQVFNSQHTVMANGSGLIGTSGETQSSVIVKQPGNNNIYYLFTLNVSNIASPMAYSIVDMSLAAGLGSVTVKNNTLYIGTSEKQVAIRHCNGRDVWILSHSSLGSNFISHLLTDAGVSTNSIVSNTGLTFTHSPHSVGISGYMKVSPDGRKLALAAMANETATINVGQGFYLFDFDPSTGIVSNPLYLKNTNRAYGVEFSPDGTKLYGGVGTVGINGAIYQWNLCASSQSAIVASQYSFAVSAALGSLQRGIDGKIYVAMVTSQSLSVINSPNSPGAAMSFSFNALSLAPKASGLGLPNFINPYQKIPPAPFTSTIACNSVTFKAANSQTYSGSCSAYSYPPQAICGILGSPLRAQQILLP